MQEDEPVREDDVIDDVLGDNPRASQLRASTQHASASAAIAGSFITSENHLPAAEASTAQSTGSGG